MILTQEQERIVNSSLKSFKINAVAGSGKTTTLLLYAQKNPHLKILYLAYNKSLQVTILDKLKIFKLSNLHTSTIHSLAYNKTRAYNFHLTNEIKTHILDRFLSYYELDTKQKTFYASNLYLAVLKDFVNFYCNSSLINIDEKLIDNFIKQSDFEAQYLELINKDKKSLLEHLKAVLGAMKRKELEATHDFYLKMYYLNKNLSNDIDFDLILIDEAQDISDVMIAIVERFNKNRIYVGDSFQQIYSFRYATNALNKIDLPTYNLTTSFRFSNSYAKTLQSLLNKIYTQNGAKTLYISGISEETKIGLEFIDFNSQFTIISRTSFALISQIVKYLQDKKRLYFEGGYQSYSFMNQTVYSIFYLKNRKNEKITVDELKNFSSIYDLETFAKETKNQEYLNIIKFINTYGDNIFEINKKIKELVTTSKEDADIIFTTTHKAKGMEYEQVIMTDDFITKKDIQNTKKSLSFNQINEELNIYYVASTRVKKCIALASLE